MASKNITLPRSIGRALSFTTGRMNALCQHLLDPHDLTLAQWVILSCLWRAGDLAVGTLADLNGNGLPATSRIIDRMAERGLVERRKHETDRRVMVVSLTPAGEALRPLATFYEQVNDTVLAGFTADERDQAFVLLARMEANANRALETPQV